MHQCQPTLRSPTSIIPHHSSNPFLFADDHALPQKSPVPFQTDYDLALHKRRFAPCLDTLPVASEALRVQAALTAIHARRTMFLVDWDDTCCATTYLERLGLMTGGAAGINTGTGEADYINPDYLSGVADWLAILEQRVLSVLKTAVRLGVAVIVTNAGDGWVELSSARFLPAVKAFLDEHHSSVKIISARARYIDVYRQFPWKWKALTFRDILATAALETSTSTGGEKLHVVVLGDSPGDTYAAYDSAEYLAKIGRSVIMKIVKFLERPTIDQLCKQLAVLLDHLVVMTKYNGYFLVSMSNEKERQHQPPQQCPSQENEVCSNEYAEQVAHEDRLELQKQRAAKELHQRQLRQQMDQQQREDGVLQVVRAAHVVNPNPPGAVSESDGQLATVAGSAPLAAAV